MLLRIKEQVMIGRIFNAAHEGKGGIEGRRSERGKEVTEDRFHRLIFCLSRVRTEQIFTHILCEGGN